MLKHQGDPALEAGEFAKEGVVIEPSQAGARLIEMHGEFRGKCDVLGVAAPDVRAEDGEAFAEERAVVEEEMRAGDHVDRVEVTAEALAIEGADEAREALDGMGVAPPQRLAR